MQQAGLLAFKTRDREGLGSGSLWVYIIAFPIEGNVLIHPLASTYEDHMSEIDADDVIDDHFKNKLRKLEDNAKKIAQTILLLHGSAILSKSLEEL